MTLPYNILLQHTAIVGKTGSGKTTTAKLAIEQLVGDGTEHRVCVLDPIKSDWWGLTSSADGKRPGLPFHVLGGPHGHVPLHSNAGAAIGELVATGALPLSILDMADFEPGGQNRFFTAFADTLLKKMRGVLYLVLEEAHEFAPKERAGFDKENLSIHFAKKLATAGRSKGVRLIVVTQRTQALHNALLGSCDTLIAHRLTAPADQEPVLKWLKSNAPKDVYDEVAGSLSSLKTGHGWLCSGEASIFERRAFPRIKTFDNSATPTNDSHPVEVRQQFVDLDALRALIGTAVAEADANDPKKLKARIAELEKLARADDSGIDQSIAMNELWLKDNHIAQLKADYLALEQYRDQYAKRFAELQNATQFAFEHLTEARRALEATPAAPDYQKPSTPAAKAARPPIGARLHARTAAAPASRTPHEGITGPQQKILDAIAWLESLGNVEPDNAAVAFVAGYSSSTGGGFVNPRSNLSARGMIDYRDGRMSLTDAGRELANAPQGVTSNEELQERVLARLPGPAEKILRALISVYPQSMDNESLAAACDYGSAKGGGFVNPRSRLSALGLIDYRGGIARASDNLFPLGR